MTTEWTPGRGLLRASIAATCCGLVLSAILFGLIAVAPTVPLNAIVRVTLALIVAWIMFDVVQHFAGMVGWACSTLAFVATTAVMLSNHAAWAVLGCPLSGHTEPVAGWTAWFHPGVVTALTFFVFMGCGFATALCHRGTPGPDFAASVMSLPWWPGVRI